MTWDLHLRYVIDEIAVVFDTQSGLTEFVNECKAFGMSHFNSVSSDVMRRQDGDQEFLVRFEFLRMPGWDWRIEAMCVLGGSAPLHEVHLARHGTRSIIHASFKGFAGGDADEYEDMKRLTESELGPFKAEYRNSYGMFSYFDQGPDLPYLKPRVNLRDA
jgi:hypothetical protein